jgi:CheY-like chemotaxis protein
MKRQSKHDHKSSRQAAKPKILVIDSDPVVTAILCNCLESEKGFTVLASDNGSAGVKMAVDHTPDLIFLDVRLKDMSGLEVHDRIQSDPFTERIPVVYISSFLTLRTIEKASDMGAKGFIRKPFTPDEIYGKVERVLGYS